MSLLCRGARVDEEGLLDVVEIVQLAEELDVAHRPVEIDLDHVAAELVFTDLRQVLRRIRLELLEEYSVGRDLAEDLPIRRARHAQSDRARRPVPG